MGTPVAGSCGRERRDVSENSVVAVELRPKRVVRPGPSPKWGYSPQSRAFEKVGSRRGYALMMPQRPPSPRNPRRATTRVGRAARIPA